jgi:hypothetical protein
MNAEGQTQFPEMFATLIEHTYAIATGTERVPHIQMFLRVCANKRSNNARKRERGRSTVLFICNYKVLFIARIFYYILYLVKLIEIRSPLVKKVLEYHFKGNNVHE